MRLGLWEARAKYVAQKGGDGKKSSFGVMLGGVACSFKREVKPYEKMDIYTRVLTWDRKWLYLVSYIVRQGTRPSAYTLQPWKKAAGKAAASAKKPTIVAVSVAKYVFKQGRLTIVPETLLQEAGLLPVRPERGVAEIVSPSDEPVKASDVLEPPRDGKWTWAFAEQERLRGKRVADFMTELDSLPEDFDPENQPALGEY